MRIIRPAAAAAATVAVTLGLATTADAEKVKVESTLLIGTFDVAFDSFYIAGNVESSKKCIAGRTVQLELSYSDKPTKVVDVDVTSQNGAWGAVAKGVDGENIEAVEATVLKEKIKVSKKKTVVCGEDIAFIV